MTQSSALLREDPTASVKRESAENMTHSPVCRLHNSPPFSHAQRGGERDEAQSGATPRNFQALSTHKVNSETHRELTRDSISQKFRVHFPDNAKAVARKIGQSPKTVDLYRQHSVPNAWAAFADACRANPHFALDILEDLGIDLDGDRDGYARFIAEKRAAQGGTK